MSHIANDIFYEQKHEFEEERIAKLIEPADEDTSDYWAEREDMEQERYEDRAEESMYEPHTW